MTREQQILVENNHNLIYSFLNKYNLPIEEYYDVAAIGLCKAAKKFNAEFSKFSTFAYKCMFTTVFQEIRASKAPKRNPKQPLVYYQTEVEYKDGIFTILDLIPASENLEDDVITQITYEEKKSRLDDREKIVLEMLSDGRKQWQIAESIGCSQPHISRIRKKIISMFAEQEVK